jgi:hypothetical protein
MLLDRHAFAHYFTLLLAHSGAANRGAVGVVAWTKIVPCLLSLLLSLLLQYCCSTARCYSANRGAVGVVHLCVGICAVKQQ